MIKYDSRQVLHFIMYDVNVMKQEVMQAQNTDGKDVHIDLLDEGRLGD